MFHRGDGVPLGGTLHRVIGKKGLVYDEKGAKGVPITQPQGAVLFTQVRRLPPNFPSQKDVRKVDLSPPSYTELSPLTLYLKVGKSYIFLIMNETIFAYLLGLYVTHSYVQCLKNKNYLWR